MRSGMLCIAAALAAAWVVGATGPARAAATAAPASDSTTLTSDELEIRDNGAKSYFKGHVVLARPPMYELRADLMIQTRATGLVEARGHVRGTWNGEKGEKIVATGDRARYNPKDETAELWNNARVTRWETAVDTMPMVVTADHFLARQQEQAIWAHGHVVMEQRPRLRSISEDAKYDQQEKAMHLWGPRRVRIHVEQPKGSADFISDRAWISMDPRRARLIGGVQGHVVPAR